MKKTILISLGLAISVFLLVAAATHMSGPICSGTKAQAASANVATGAGDIYAADAIECDGNLNVAGTSTLTGAITLTGAVSAASTLGVTGVASFADDVDLSKGFSVPYTVVTDSTTLTATTAKGVILLNAATASGGGTDPGDIFVLTLPSTATISTGDLMYLVNISTDQVTMKLATTNSQTINRATTNSDADASYDRLILQNCGSNGWITVGGYISP